MANYLQLLTSYYGNTGDTSPAATGKAGWRRYTNNAGTITVDVSDGTNWVTISSGGGSSTLDALTNVQITSKADGDIPVWRSTPAKWVNEQPGAVSVPDATTTSKGKVELATDGENAANVVVQGNDSRLSDARTPTAHKNSHKVGGGDAFVKGDDLNASSRYLEDIVDMASDAQRIWLEDATANLKYWSDEAVPVKHTVEVQANKGAASGYASLDSGTKVPVTQLPDATTSAKGVSQLATSAQTTAGLVVQASDTRLSDARTPTGHAASHLSNGSDAIAAATTTVRGTVALASSGGTTAGTVVQATDARLSDARTPLTHVHSGADITTGTVADGRLSSNIPLKDAANVFTNVQKISNAGGQLMTFYRTVNALGNGGGFYYNFNDSLGAENTYGFQYVSIEDNILATLRGDFNVQLAINNTLGLRFRVFTSGNGGIIFGNNQRILVSETGLTAQRTYTLPDADTLLIGAATTKTLTNTSFNADGTGNSITNIENADIKSGANIAVSKLAAGTDTHVLTTVSGIPTWQAPTSSGAPTTAQYVTLATDATLSNERILTAGQGLKLTDAGAGNAVTIDIDPMNRLKNWIIFEDEFMGLQSTTAGNPFVVGSNGGSGTQLNAYNMDLAGGYGAVIFRTGTTSTGRVNLGTGSTTISPVMRLGQGQAIYVAVIYFPTLSTSTQRYSCKFGFMDSYTSPTNGVYFEYLESTSANWRIVNMANSVTTGSSTTSSTAVAQTAWIVLKIIVNAAGTSASFYVNGTEVSGSPMTANIPITSGQEVGIGAGITKSVGTTERTLIMDYMGGFVNLTTVRLI